MSVAAKVAAFLRPHASRRNVGSIGIDFSLEAVHLVQLEAIREHRPRIRAQASVNYGCSRREFLISPDRFRSIMKQALNSGPFVGRKAVVAVPSGLFRTISINYRSSAKEGQEDAAIVQVMKARLDGDLSNYVIDYLPVKSRSKSKERLALVAVSQRDEIVELLELLRKCRIDVEALEIGPVSITRFIRALAVDSAPQNILVINSGRRASYLTLISGDDLLFDQEVDLGEDSLVSQVAETLDMDEGMARDLVQRTGFQGSDSSTLDDDGIASTLSEILKPQFLKLVEEIKRVCLYAAAETRGGAVTHLHLLGSLARWPGADRILSSMTGVSVANVPEPLHAFSEQADRFSSGTDSSAPHLAVATGLALRGVPFHV